ncbi:MAG: hypothetical protein MJK10_07180 [Pseudomonadales bacterium]|nr:hypothetical protein [Pseudomonadales bacterium]NRA13919.1 hypothetical protein [Oceanospirillaceae bacterium]
MNKDQIKIVFNFYDPDLKVDQLYPSIFESSVCKSLGLDQMCNVFTITGNSVFDMVGEIGKSFSKIANDDRDFKMLIRSTRDKNKRSVLSHQRIANRLATGFNRELDLTFSKIITACGIVLEGKCLRDDDSKPVNKTKLSQALQNAALENINEDIH